MHEHVEQKGLLNDMMELQTLDLLRASIDETLYYSGFRSAHNRIKFFLSMSAMRSFGNRNDKVYIGHPQNAYNMFLRRLEKITCYFMGSLAA